MDLWCITVHQTGYSSVYRNVGTLYALGITGTIVTFVMIFDHIQDLAAYPGCLADHVQAVVDVLSQ